MGDDKRATYHFDLEIKAPPTGVAREAKKNKPL
jgi:hypothetical protein